MTSKRLLGVLLATLLGAAATAGSPDLLAQSKPAPALWSDAPSSKKAITLPFPWLRWGSSLEQIAKDFDRILEKDYRPLVKKAKGDELARLSQERSESRARFAAARCSSATSPPRSTRPSIAANTVTTPENRSR